MLSFFACTAFCAQSPFSNFQSIRSPVRTSAIPTGAGLRSDKASMSMVRTRMPTAKGQRSTTADASIACSVGASGTLRARRCEAGAARTGIRLFCFPRQPASGIRTCRPRAPKPCRWPDQFSRCRPLILTDRWNGKKAGLNQSFCAKICPVRFFSDFEVPFFVLSSP